MTEGLLRKPRVCLDCRTLLGFKERCDISTAHRSISPRTSKGRARWVQRVWGKDLSNARLLMRESIEGPLTWGLAGYSVRFVSGRIEPGYPRGAEVALTWADGGESFRGRVVACEKIDTPFGRVESAGFGLTLVTHLGGRAAMLRFAECASFEVEGDDDRRLTIPAGRIRLMGPTGVYRSDFVRLKPWLQGIVEHLDADLPTPFPFDEAHQCWLRRGDIVEVQGNFDVNDQQGPYRSTPPPPPATVRVRVLERP